MKWETRWPIRTRLHLLLLVLVLPFLFYIALSAWQQAAREHTRVQNEMLDVARLTAARLDDHIDNIRQLLSVLSTVVGPAPEDQARNNALLHDLATRLPAHFNNVTVWTADGKNIGAMNPLPRAQNMDVRQRRYFQQAMASPGLTIEAPQTSMTNGELVGLFGLRIERNGLVVALVTASTRLTVLQALLAPRDTLPPGAVMTVSDVGGVVLARSVEPEKWIGRNLLTVGAGGLAESLRRRDGVRDGASADGIDRIAGFTTATRVPWLVYVGIPSGMALAPFKRQMFESAAVGALILLLGVVLAGRVARRIATPLRRLSADAAAFERGDAMLRTPVDQGGEIGNLAATLNRAADALLQRTEALQNSREQLRQITDNLPVMISYLDPRQRFLFANRVHQEWFGIDATSLIGATAPALYGEVAYQKSRQHFDAALGGQRVVYECELATHVGMRRLEVTLVPHRLPSGVVQGLFVLGHDVTASRRAEELLARSEERLSLALEGSNLALFDWDIARDRLFHDPQALAMRGYAAAEVTTSMAALQQEVHPEDRDATVLRMQSALAGETGQYDAEFRVSTAAGGWVWMRARARVVERDAAGRAVRLAGTYVDVTQRRSAEDQLRQLAESDVLTGLPNRALFMDRLGQAITRTARGGKAMALMYLDIDHFKSVNDTLGHEAGDVLLRTFAQRMLGCVRGSDTVARLGGDEFTIILESLGGPEDAEAVARNVVAQGRLPVTAGSQTVNVSTSVGVAMVAPGETDAAAIMRRADAALYRAKRLGRDRYVF